MRTLKEGIKFLKSLKPGCYHCKREIQRDNYSAPPKNGKEVYLFTKDKYIPKYPYEIIGSDSILSERDLLLNCYGEFTPLFNITRVK